MHDECVAFLVLVFVSQALNPSSDIYVSDSEERASKFYMDAKSR